MRKISKNNHAASVEFAISILVFSTSLFVVTASITPSVEQASVQFYTVAEDAAVKISGLLISSTSEVGLVDSDIQGISPDEIPGDRIEDAADLEVCIISCVGTGTEITVSFTIKNLRTPNSDGCTYEISIYDISGSITGSRSGTEGGPLDQIQNGFDRDIEELGIPITSSSSKVTVTITPYNYDASSSNNEATIELNKSPYTPSNPDPYAGKQGVSKTASLSWSGGDPDSGDTVSYDIYFGISSTPPKVDTVSHPATTTTITWSPSSMNYETTYNWTIIASDGSLSSNGILWSFTTKDTPNTPPAKPTEPYIDGIQLIYTGTVLTFNTETTDPEGNQISYLFDWGDGSNSGWIGLYDSGETANTTKSYSSSGRFDVKVKAKDTLGDESDWSDSCPVLVITQPAPPVPTLPTEQYSRSTGCIGVTYYFSSSGEVGGTIKFSWGDGFESPWISTSVGWATYGHSYSNFGIYFITAKQKVNDVESGWSYPLLFNIPEVKSVDLKCFQKDTQIVMADYTTKNIQDMQIDDEVMSYNTATKSFTTDIVTEVYSNSPEDMLSDYTIKINDDVVGTPEHLVLTNNICMPKYLMLNKIQNLFWKPLSELKVGDLLLNGRVNSIERLDGRISTFNMETKTYHNYLVRFSDGANMIVHNGGRYVVSGNEEGNGKSMKTPAVTNNDLSTILSMDLILQLGEMSYDELEVLLFGELAESEDFKFSITIDNSRSTFLHIPLPEGFSPDVQASHTEHLVVNGNDRYAYATMTVTVAH